MLFFKIYCVEYLLKIRIFKTFCVEYFENQSIQKIWDIQDIPQDYFEYSNFQQVFNSSVFLIFAISPCDAYFSLYVRNEQSNLI